MKQFQRQCTFIKQSLPIIFNEMNQIANLTSRIHLNRGTYPHNRKTAANLKQHRKPTHDFIEKNV